MASVTIMDAPVPSFDEAGHPGGLQVAWHHELGPGYVAQSYEENLDLTGNAFVAVADRMRRTDGQVGALLRSINLPILRNTYSLATEGVSNRVARFVESEIGLHALDKTRRRHGGNHRRVVLREHLREALLALPLGYMPFERVYRVDEPTPEQAAVPGMPPMLAHLGRLAPRMPRTIQEIRVHRNGELAGLIQAPVGWDAAGKTGNIEVVGSIGGGKLGDNDSTETWLPAEHLTFYCFEREGADWAGSSLLRPVYKDWLIKDQLIRTDAVAGERNGVGVPVVYFSDEGGGTRAEALSIAQAFRAGGTAGAAIPDGKYRLELLGVSGQVRDLLPSIKYHDQSVSRSALAMFLDLGQTSSGLGQGSLGDTFRDYFAMSLQYVNEWLVDTFTETTIRDLVAINFGPDEPYPALVCDEISAESTPTAEALKALVDAGILTPDEALEDETRRRYNLAKRPEGATRPAPPVPTPDPPVPAATDTEPAAETTDPAAAEPQPAAALSADPLLDRAQALVQRIADLRGQ